MGDGVKIRVHLRAARHERGRTRPATPGEVVGIADITVSAEVLNKLMARGDLMVEPVTAPTVSRTAGNRRPAVEAEPAVAGA